MHRDNRVWGNVVRFVTSVEAAELVVEVIKVPRWRLID